MANEFYITPMTSPPYSILNKQRPLYVDTIRADWTGAPLLAYDRYIIKADVDVAQAAQFAASKGVIHFPSTSIRSTLGSLPLATQTAIINELIAMGVRVYSTETLEFIMQRLVVSSTFGLLMEEKTAELRALTIEQQMKVSSLMNNTKTAFTSTDTIDDIIKRVGIKLWDPVNTPAGVRLANSRSN